MPVARPLVKARLVQMNEGLKDLLPGGKSVTVQFNPETLKLSLSNTVASAGAGENSGSAPKQVTGTGTGKLSLQLWFDVTAPLPDGRSNIEDVRELTQDVEFFINPDESKKPAGPPPGVRFEWGSFQFDGLVESLEESLEFFSNDGKPLRASIALNLVQQKPLKQTPASSGSPGRASPGARPLTAAQAGATLQGLAESAGSGANWQAIAAANGIENPRLLPPGKLIDINARASLSLG